MGVHHMISDGPGCDGFLRQWAEHSKALSLGQTPPTYPPPVLDPAASDLTKATPERMADLKPLYLAIKDAAGPKPPPPADFRMPPLVQQMWHFPRSKAAALKATASPSSSEDWISTYDAIVALLWSRVTVAKVPLLHPSPSKEAILIHGFDTRKSWDPPLPKDFFGQGAVALRPSPAPISEIINTPANLPALAGAIRASIKGMTPPFLNGLVEYISSHDDQRYLETDIDSFLGLDFAASSWRDMTAYETHDFGFGLPKALRWPSPQFEGFVFLYPSRAGVKEGEGAEDEGIEVCVCLEESCHERLMRDEVLLGFAEPR
jgi:hypothetical protein